MRRYYLAGLMLVVLQQFALAQDDGLEVITLDPRASADYWTSERFESAEPRTPVVKFSHVLKSGKHTTGRGIAIAGEAALSEMTRPRPPAVRVKPYVGHLLFAPGIEPQKAHGEDAKDSRSSESRTIMTPQDMGTMRAHFTSSRLIPLVADRSYPYRTIGKLFFFIPGEGRAECSAAVIAPRIVLTAGHCVHSGRGGAAGYFTDFVFAPAFRDGVAPFQRWNATAVIAPATWTTGGGAVPNAADYALIELQDRPIGGVARRVGAVTGWLGVQTVRLHPNHVHLLGYPGNLDRGLKMHQVTASSFGAGGNRTILYGSDMGPGSSGGPWVQNFQTRALGQTGGSNSGSNLIVGVTSYGAVNVGPRAQGSSILDSRFTSILNAICARRAGNCR